MATKRIKSQDEVESQLPRVRTLTSLLEKQGIIDGRGPIERFGLNSAAKKATLHFLMDIEHRLRWKITVTKDLEDLRRQSVVSEIIERLKKEIK